MRLDLMGLKTWLAAETLRARAAAASGFDDAAESVAFFVAQGKALAPFVADAAENTDVHPHLELNAPLNLHSENGLRNLVELSKIMTSPRELLHGSEPGFLKRTESIQLGIKQYVAAIAAWNEGRLDEADRALAESLQLAPGSIAVSQSLSQLRGARAAKNK